MKLEKMLKACGQAQRECAVDEEKLQRTLEKSKAAFRQGEESGALSWLEFLYQQSTYIQKRWWLAQGLVLLRCGCFCTFRRAIGISAAAWVC